MKKTIGFIVAITLIASCVTIHAQTEIGFPILKNVDVATPAQARFDGWTFNCTTGRHIRAIQVWRTNLTTGVFEVVDADVFWGPRPDVQVYAAWRGCRPTEIATGFVVITRQPTPSGSWQYDLLFADAPDSQQTGHYSVRVVVP